MDRQDVVWQRSGLVHTFVNEVRGGVPYAADQLEMMMRVIAARGEPVRRFVDLGCGSGVLARTVLAHYPDAHATLLDFSPAMLDEARAQLGGQANVHIAAADLATNDWLAAIVGGAPDLVVSGYAIHHLAHGRKRELYAEIFDLLAPGGLFLNVEHVASRAARLEAISDDLMVDTIHAFQQRKGSTKNRTEVAAEFVHRPDKAANILAPVEDQCLWLRDIGFDDVDCFFKVFELAVFGGRKPGSATSARWPASLPATITSERLSLREPVLDDAQAIYDAWATDPECTRYLMWRPHTAIHQTREFLERVARGPDPLDPTMGHPWLVSTKEGEVIGMIDLRVGASGAEIGYVYRRSSWGKGYGSEAARAVIEVGLGLPGIYRVWATCDVDNLASARVLEKAGMTREGLLRRYILHPNVGDEPRDSYLFAVTR